MVDPEIPTTQFATYGSAPQNSSPASTKLSLKHPLATIDFLSIWPYSQRRNPHRIHAQPSGLRRSSPRIRPQSRHIPRPLKAQFSLAKNAPFLTRNRWIPYSRYYPGKHQPNLRKTPYSKLGYKHIKMEPRNPLTQYRKPPSSSGFVDILNTESGTTLSKTSILVTDSPISNTQDLLLFSYGLNQLPNQT